MFQRILVPLDGSERAERALPFAARIARATRGSLLLVRVIHPPRSAGIYGAEPGVAVASTSFEKHLAGACEYLQTVALTYSHELEGLQVMTDVESGDVAPAIFTAARVEQTDLIVMSHHEETGWVRSFLRSVAQQTVRRSPVPVLVLGEHATIPLSPGTQRIWRALVPLDGSERAEYALLPVASLIAALATPGLAELRLLSVVTGQAIGEHGNAAAYPSVEMPQQIRKGAELYLERVVQRLQRGPLAELSLKISASAVVSPDVPGTILQHAHQVSGIGARCDLIAMATHGRSGMHHLLMGSVTERLLDTATLPMLVVRPPAADAPEEASTLAGSALP